jgi:hypothetical protein
MLRNRSMEGSPILTALAGTAVAGCYSAEVLQIPATAIIVYVLRQPHCLQGQNSRAHKPSFLVKFLGLTYLLQVLPTFTVNRTRSDTNNIKPKQEKVRELLPKLT